MENKLKTLFDFQAFEKNEKLEKLIREAESRYGKELSDDVLSLVSAAGDPVIDADSGGSTPQENEQIGKIAGLNENGRSITVITPAG